MSRIAIKVEKKLIKIVEIGDFSEQLNIENNIIIIPAAAGSMINPAQENLKEIVKI